MDHPFAGANILITGATGFVGSHVTEELLIQGAHVTALISDFHLDSRFYQRGLLHGVVPIVGSLGEFQLLQRILRENKIETVIHLAAVATEGFAFQQPLAAFDVNIRGTYHLLEACRLQGPQVRKIIVASSDKSYGSSPTLPYSEDFPLLGRHPYDVSKSCADMITQTYFHSYGLPVIIGRYGNIFGPGDRNFDRLIPGTLRRLYRNENPVLKVHANGPFTRDFLFIQDVVQSYVAMFQGLDNPRNHGEAFNFALSVNWEVKEVISRLQKITQTEHLPVRSVLAPHGEIQHQHVANEKAATHLGWSPNWDMEEALRITAEWYFRWFESIGEDRLEFERLKTLVQVK